MVRCSAASTSPAKLHPARSHNQPPRARSLPGNHLQRHQLPNVLQDKPDRQSRNSLPRCISLDLSRCSSDGPSISRFYHPNGASDSEEKTLMGGDGGRKGERGFQVAINLPHRDPSPESTQARAR